jgi:hypothetical protein
MTTPALRSAHSLRLIGLAATLILGPAESRAATFFNSFTSVLAECTAVCSGVTDDQGTASSVSSLAERGIASTAVAGAGIGWVRALASVIVQDDPVDDLGRGVATAEGEFSDRFVIDGGALNGMTGFMDFSVSAGGSAGSQASSDLTIDPFPGANASFRTNVDLQASCSGCELSLQDYVDPTTSGAGVLSGTLEFVFGSAIDVFVDGIASAQVQGDGSALADFSSTVEWGGISEIRDEFGNVVSAFSIVSDSGVDWSQPVVAPVPEPGVLLLLLGSLGAGGAWTGRRSRRA